MVNKCCTFLHILQMFLPDHQVFPEGLQESEDFASSAQSTAELIKKENYVSKKCIFWTNLERKNCALKIRQARITDAEELLKTVSSFPTTKTCF